MLERAGLRNLHTPGPLCPEQWGMDLGCMCGNGPTTNPHNDGSDSDNQSESFTGQQGNVIASKNVQDELSSLYIHSRGLLTNQPPPYFELLKRITFGCEFEAIVAGKQHELEQQFGVTLQEEYKSDYPEHAQSLEEDSKDDEGDFVVKGNHDYWTSLMCGQWPNGSYRNLLDFGERLMIKYVKSVLQEKANFDIAEKANRWHKQWIVVRDITVKWIKWADTLETEHGE